MKYIDLTGTIENGMWEYGDPFPPVEITPVSSLDGADSYADYKVNTHRISFSSSSATYVQTPAEMLPGRPTIDRIPLDRLVLECSVIKIPKQPRGKITPEDIIKSNPGIKKGGGLIVATGWEKYWRSKNFVKDSPHFTPESMEMVLDFGISMLAGDMTIYDDYYAPTGLLKKLFEKDVLIAAPLVNLDQITTSRVRLFALPLKVKGVSGCPARIIALEI